MKNLLIMTIFILISFHYCGSHEREIKLLWVTRGSDFY